MSTIGPLLLNALALYLVIGTCAGVAFFLDGYRRLLPEPAPVTWPARLLLTPGAMLLWPLVVKRSLQAPADEPRAELDK